MNALENKSLNTLEYTKITAMLADFTVCEDASKIARELLPAENLDEALIRLTETEDAHKLSGKKGSPSFADVRSIEVALMRAEKGAPLSLRELLDVCTVLRTARKLIDYCDENAEGLAIKQLFKALEADRHVEEKIANAIISEEEIADNASPELFSIRRAINASILKAKEILQKMIRSQSTQKYLQESIITMRGDRYVVPVKIEHKGDVPGLVHDTSGSGSTLFVEPMAVVEANNELRMLKVKEQNEIERIVYELSSDVANITEKLKRDYDVIVRLDFAFAKAKFAYQLKASRPVLNDKGIIELKKARHPLIDPKVVVPTNITLGGSFDTLVITGPNTGGKTVTLKTLGLFVLMAQAGLYIPCEEGSRTSYFSRVLADIGDEQSIEQSLSTFSSHMTNIVRIMDTVDKETLVLFDELGAGTDPTEGAALAVAILERARMFGAKVAATTHYAELKIYALRTPGVENASCEFDVQTLKPTYRLLIGVPGKSNAFAISRKLGLDDGIIDRAKEQINDENVKFEDVLSDLERKRQQMEREREEAENVRTEITALKARLQAEKEKFDTSKDRETEKARQDAKRVLVQAKRTFEEILDELNEIKKQKDKEDFDERLAKAKASVKAKISSMDDMVDPVEKKETSYVLPRPLKIGDTVKLSGIAKGAVVLTLPDEKGEMTVQAGIIKTKVKVSEVRLISGADAFEKRTAKRKTGDSAKMTASIHTELDLRGKLSDEAILELDKFLDDAALSGVNLLTIIHGKGTGALRSAVHSHLRGHPHIRTFRLGVYGEGESGVTIAELR